MTLEEAQARILELTDENTQLKADKEELSKDNETLKADYENLRTLNQSYFNRLIAQEQSDEGDEGEEDDTPTCSEFAKTLADKF